MVIEKRKQTGRASDSSESDEMGVRCEIKG